MYAYNELVSKFNRSSNPHKGSYKLENNTYVENVSIIGNQYDIILHGSIIAKITQDKIILDSCGYRTMTTKDRLNKILNDNKTGYQIYQDHWQWYLYTSLPVNYKKYSNDDRIPFYNGITFIYETSPLMGIGWRLNTE